MAEIKKRLKELEKFITMFCEDLFFFVFLNNTLWYFFSTSIYFLITLFFLINPIFFIFFWYEFYFCLFFVYHIELFEMYFYITKGLFKKQHIAHFLFCISFVLLLKNNLIYFLIFGFLSIYIKEVTFFFKILIICLVFFIFVFLIVSYIV